MTAARKNINVKLTGQIIDEIALSLVDNANDKDPEVRQVLVDSIIQLGLDRPNLVLSAIVYSLHKDTKLPQSHKVVLLTCMEKVIEGSIEGVSEDVAVMVIQQIFLEMTHHKSKGEESQESASKVAVVLAIKFCHELMTELLERLHSDQLPHYYVLHTLGQLALANVFGMVPYFKTCLSVCVPLLETVKSDSMKMAYTRMLANFSEAVIDYMANMENAPDKSVNKPFYSQEFSAAFDVLFNNWLNTKEIKLKASILECLGRISHLLPYDSLTSYFPKYLNAIYSVYKKNNDLYMVTQGLYLILEVCIQQDIFLIEPHLDILLVNLFNQSTSTVDLDSSNSVKNHNEILRCYSILAKKFPERISAFALNRLESSNEKIKIGALNIIQHIVNYAGESLKEKEGLIMNGLKGATNDQNIKVKQTLVQTILKLAHYNYLHLDGGFVLVDFILKQCLCLSKSDKETNKNHNGTTEETLKEYCKNVLHLLSSTVPNISSVLWPQMLTYLTNKNFTSVVHVVCRTLDQVLKKMNDNEKEVKLEIDKRDSIPKTQEIFMRLLVLLIRPEDSIQATQIISFMLTISSTIHPKLFTIWHDSLEGLVANKNENDAWERPDWENYLLNFLSDSLVAVSDDGWIILCGDYLIRQMLLYEACSVEKTFLYKCLGVCCCLAKKNEFVRLSLTAIFDQTQHTNALERESCAASLGLASRTHFTLTMDWLENVCKAKKQSAFISFIKEAVGELDEKYKASLVLSYGHMALQSPIIELRPNKDTILFNKLDVNLNQIKDVVIKESTIKSIELLALAFYSSKDDDKIYVYSEDKNKYDEDRNNAKKGLLVSEPFSHKRFLLERLKAAMQQESQTSVQNDVKTYIINAMCSLVVLKPELTKEECKDLFFLVVSRVMLLPVGSNEAADNKRYEERVHNCVEGVVKLGACLMRVDTGPEMFGNLFEVLRGYLRTPDIRERERSIQVLHELVHIYLAKINVSMMDQLPCLGGVMAILVARCCDPSTLVRTQALSCIEMLLKISMRYAGRAPDHRDEWVDKVETLSSYFPLKDSDAMFAFITQLSHILNQRLGIEHVLSFVEGLMEGLTESDQTCQSASCLMLTNTIKKRGPELHGVVENTFVSMIKKLPYIPNQQTTTGLLRAMRWLAHHHLLKVIGYLLQEPFPLSALTCEIWKFIGQDKNLIQPITEHLVDMLSRTLSVEEVSEGMWSKDHTYKRATQLSLAITCALSELLTSDESFSAAKFLYPQLLCQLLLQVSCFCNAKPPKLNKKPNSKESPKPHTTIKIENTNYNTPYGLSVEALRRFIVASKNDLLIEELRLAHVWEDLKYEDVDVCVDVFCVIIRKLVTYEASIVAKVINILNPILSSPIPSQRLLVVAVFAELIDMKCADDMTSVNLLVNCLLSRLGDHDLRVKMLCLRGLGNLASCGKQMLQKNSSMLLTALTAGIDGGVGSGEGAILKEMVCVEAMKGLSKVLHGLENEEVRQMLVNIAVRIRPCFEKENCNMRSKSLKLFGDLVLIGMDECREPITEQIHMNFVSIILHLNDPVLEVVKASTRALKASYPLMVCDQLEDVVGRVCAWVDARSDDVRSKGKIEDEYDAFVQEIAYVLMKGIPDKAATYLNICMTYFKSQQAPIRCNAVILLGYLLAGAIEEGGGMVTDRDSVFRAIMALLSDHDKQVKMKTAIVLKHMGRGK